jgi:hypothetical protein
MWTTLALAAISLAPAQGGALELSNIRPTYGVLGAPRSDTDYLPGDELFLAFEIDGIKIDDAGSATYTMSTEVTNSKGKVQFKQDPEKLQTSGNYLGGTRLPAFAHLEIGLDMPADEYTLKLSIIDLGVKNGKPAELTRKFKVLPPALGIVRVGLSYDSEGRLPAPMQGVVGEQLMLHYFVVGFERDATKDKKKPQPDLSFDLRILDEKGKPTLAKPISDRVPNKLVPEVAANLRHLNLDLPIVLSRPGSYTVELTVTDYVAKKKAVTLTFPLKVLATDKGK